MRLKTKQRGPLKADKTLQAERLLFRFVLNESFPNVSRSIANSNEISKTLNINILSPFREEYGTIRVKGRLKHSNIDYNVKQPILLTVKHPVVQLLLEKAHLDKLHEGTEYCEKHAVTKVLVHWIKKCFTENKVEMYEMQTQKRQPESSTDGTTTTRTTWWICVRIPSYRRPILRTFRSQVPMTYFEEMRLPLQLSNNERSAHRSRTVIVHRVMPSCSDTIHCKTLLSKHNHQWQQNKLRSSSQWVESIDERVGQI